MTILAEVFFLSTNCLSGVGWNWSMYVCTLYSKNWVAPKDWETRRSGRRGGRCRCVYHHRLIYIDTMIPTIYFLLHILLFWYNILLFVNVLFYYSDDFVCVCHHWLIYMKTLTTYLYLLQYKTPTNLHWYHNTNHPYTFSIIFYTILLHRLLYFQRMWLCFIFQAISFLSVATAMANKHLDTCYLYLWHHGTNPTAQLCFLVSCIFHLKMCTNHLDRQVMSKRRFNIYLLWWRTFYNIESPSSQQTDAAHMFSKYIHSRFWGPESVSSSG